jgi:hypothetical protein
MRRSRYLCIPALLAVGVVSSISSPALGKQSSFRVVDIQPTATGACLTVSYDNVWDDGADTAKNETNRWVNLCPIPQVPGQPDYSRWHDGTGKIRVDMLGSGTVQVPLDYAALRLAPGMSIEMYGSWEASSHGWGYDGRPSGKLTLPELAAKNAAFRHRSVGLGRLLGIVSRPPRFEPRTLGLEDRQKP